MASLILIVENTAEVVIFVLGRAMRRLAMVRMNAYWKHSIHTLSDDHMGVDMQVRTLKKKRTRYLHGVWRENPAISAKYQPACYSSWPVILNWGRRKWFGELKWLVGRLLTLFVRGNKFENQ